MLFRSALALSYWGFLVPHAWFQGIAIASAAVSTLLIVLTWNNQFVFAMAINLAIVVWAVRWPPQ